MWEASDKGITITDREGAPAMKLTTLCYLEREGAYLMMLRNRKAQDENAGKWIGIGGKFQEGESPEECLRREILEETGLAVRSVRFRGIVTFVSDLYGTEYMHLFTSEDFSGTPGETDEGELHWIPKEQILSLPLWEGDRLFLPLLTEEKGFFSLKLLYRGDDLTGSELNLYPES